MFQVRTLAFDCGDISIVQVVAEDIKCDQTENH
jgi:hypothetical protein